MKEQRDFSRRDFLVTMAAAGVAAQGLPILTARAQNAPRSFKVGLVGCGGRGCGAADNILEAARHLKVEASILAVADAFQDRADGAGQRFGVAADKRFVGYDAYRKLLELPVDIVLLATPPNFRPAHFEAAVSAGKHCFIEKPVAVDAPGVRRMLAAGEEARKKNLAVVAGTQRRHHADHQRNQQAVQQGAIGRIVGGTVSWCGGSLWFKARQEGESDASYMTRNWTSFAEMSGDHIVEQHVHNLDVANWFIGHPPVSAIGFGGRARRKTGNQFDFFSVSYDYGDGCVIHSMCRQVNGTYGRVGESFTGTEGTAYGSGKIERFDKKPAAVPQCATHPNGQVQEHIDLLQSIVDEKPLNEVKNVAEATLTALMGRTSAYTGQLVRWVDLMSNESSPFYNLKLAPSAEDFEKGTVAAPKDDVVPVPGNG